MQSIQGDAEAATAKVDPLSSLLDCAGLVRELGVTRAAAEAIMRQVDKVEFPGLRKVYVLREDVRRLIEASMRAA
jgi:hypothetical protein